MKIRPISDIHLELFKDDTKMHKAIDLVIPVMDDENNTILILCGDICKLKSIKTSFFEKMSLRFKHIIWILGNHEYWGGSLFISDNKLKRIEHLKNISILNNSKISIDGYNFVGTTLWSNFSNNPQAKMEFSLKSRDLKKIRTGTKANPYSSKFTVLDHICESDKSVKFLEDNLEENDILLTHHAVSFMSTKSIFYETNYFYSLMDVRDISDLIIDRKPLLCIHGHTHVSCDYTLGESRVISNPVGYIAYNEANKKFNPNLVLEI